jgi:CubicO group peptidase (beta-lactamase class C family)
MKRHPLLYIAGALIGSASLLSFSAHSQSNSSTPVAPKGLEELQMEIRNIMAAEHIPGAGIALVAKDRILWEGGLGKANLKANTEVTADTCFRTGAISNSLVALALLKLQEDGKIDLEAKLADLAPELHIPNAWQSSHPVTVANLLEQTAGFDDVHESGIYNVGDPQDISLLDILQKLNSPLTARWPPATRMSYSNPGYGVAGYLIEKISNEPFDQYIRENILTPMGATYSDFQLTTNLNLPLLAEGYEENSSKPVPYVSFYLRPADDFKSSAKELALLVQMFLNRGRIGETQLLKPESILRMEYPQTTLAANAGLKYGYGLGNYADFTGPVVAHGHDGRIDGFTSSYHYLPDQSLGWVILVNTSASAEAMKKIQLLVMNYLLAGESVSQATPMMLSAADLDKFTGYYEQGNPHQERFKFLDLLLNGRRIVQEYGTLYQKNFFEANQVLVPVSASQFRLDKEQAASRIFFAGENGEMVYADQRFYGVRTDGFWPVIRLALVILGLALMASSVVYVLVWIPLKIMGRTRSERYLPRLMEPALATLSLAAAWFIYHLTPAWLLGVYDILTAAIWFLTWVFAIFSVWSLLLAVQSFRWSSNRNLRIYTLLVAVACCGIAAYLGYWHMIGLRLWAP